MYPANVRVTCHLCGKDGGRLCHDHDHGTGMLRGILCNSCNSRLGWYERNKEAIDGYLSASPLSEWVPYAKRHPVDPDRQRAWNRASYERNKEKVAERSRKWVKENWERERARIYKWREANPDKWAEIQKRSYEKRSKKGQVA